MEKRYALFLDVIKRFQSVGLLDDLILIGSWCLYFYKEYFSKAEFLPTIRTRDMDFLVPTPVRIKKKVDVTALLKDEGFIVSFSGDKGYMKLMHPELIIEFLVPERGRGLDRPYPLPQLGMNAQPLRYLDYLASNTICIETEGLRIRLPHPAAFALHKLIISTRRQIKAKALKEKREALSVLTALVNENKSSEIRQFFNKMPKRWQKKVIEVLKGLGQEVILKL